MSEQRQAEAPTAIGEPCPKCGEPLSDDGDCWDDYGFTCQRWLWCPACDWAEIDVPTDQPEGAID